MATSRVGPLSVARALPAAPVPRPPQPTSASLMVSSPAACTCGNATSASTEAATATPVDFKTSRRERPLDFLRSMVQALVAANGWHVVIGYASGGGTQGISSCDVANSPTRQLATIRGPGLRHFGQQMRRQA